MKGEYSYNMHTSSEQVNNPIRSNEEFRANYPGQTAIKTLIIKNDGVGTNAVPTPSFFIIKVFIAV